MKGIPEGVFGGDNRAVAPVLGVILLFGIAAIGLSVWQTTVIPDQNADTEFKHYMEVQGDMGDLRQAHLETVASGEPQAPTLKLGVAYTTRIIGVNPPNPTGSIRDENLGNFTLQEANASTSGNPVTTADVCGQAQPPTDRLRYDPSYNRLSDRETQPVMYENTVLYRKTADGRYLFESDQLLIRGSTINILPVQTNLNRTRRSTSIDLSSEGYAVEKDLETGATPTLVVPTKIPASRWENELLDSQTSKGYISGVADVPNSDKVRINLAETPGQFPWTVRCAITTGGDRTTVPDDVATLDIRNGGVGRGGTTEHTVDSNTDKIVIPNGKWINVSNIAGIKYGNAEADPINGNNAQGQGVILDYTIQDGTSDEKVEVKIEAAYDPGNDEYVGYVGFSDDPSNDPSSMQLRPDAARRIVETGVEDGPDILDDSNYVGTFQGQGINSLVETILGMESATLRTTNVAGRVDMKVESGDLVLDIDDEDRSQTIREGETSEIEFDVTATGMTDDPENVDLVIRDSSGQQIDSAAPRADRETLDSVSGQESFTLTWEPNWEQIDSGEYQILVEGESDQAFATVEVFQSGDIYIEVEIDNTTSPVDYGDTLEANVSVENVGDTDADDAQLALSMAGQDGPQPQFDLPAGESTTLTLEYDTQENLNPENTGEKTLKATWNDESTDTETVVVEQPDVILDPYAEDLTAGDGKQTQTFGFTLGEDLTEGDEISVDVSDTGSAVEYDGDGGNWTVIQGDGTEVSPDIDNGKIIYKVGSGDAEGKTIRFEGAYVDASSAESDIVYDIEYRVESSDTYAEQANGDTNSTSFESTDDIIEVEILESESRVEYGETVETDIRVENVGSTDAENVQLNVSMAGQDGPQPEFDLEAGEEDTITTSYDTGENLDPSNTGPKTLEVTWNNESTDTGVFVEQADVIREPYAEDVTATDGNQTQAFEFTLDEDLTEGDEISVDVSDSGNDIEYDNDNANWTIVNGSNDAQLSLELDEGKVIYVVGADDDAGETIRFEGAYVDASSAGSGDSYDVEYRVKQANSYAEGNNGDNDFTSFESTGVILEPSAGDVTAGSSEESQTFNFTLGADLAEGDEITINVSDTGGDIRYDGDDDSWNVVQGPASAQVTPDIDNGTVTYRAGGEETENSTIRIRADSVDASSAESDDPYIVEYRVESAKSLADGNDGDTNTASFVITD